MIITPQSMAYMFQNINMAFMQSYNDYQPQYQQISTTIPSNTKSNTYPMMNVLPVMRKWVGERVVQNAETQDFTIKNDPFESTLEVDRHDIEDDNLGLINVSAQTLGMTAAQWPDDLVFDLLKRGEEVECFDDQNFFDTDHPSLGGSVGAPGTISNLFTYTGTELLTRDNLLDVENKVARWKSGTNKPLQLRMRTLVVPQGLESQALQLVAPTNENGGANIWANRYNIIVAPQLNDMENEAYVMDLSRPLKPLIWQMRQQPRFTDVVNEDSENVFWRHRYLYGVDGRGNAGFGLWFLAAKLKLS